MIKASMWSGTLALAALISLPLQAAEPVKVGSKIDTEGGAARQYYFAGSGKPWGENRQ
ncbi:Osmoprotectant ABC transporter binding protein YehZ [Klebsiella michiganensis]|nr:Osmoprotectant ABC transporter binding protein YehZ [Klebsiella michiganensis]